MSKGGYQSQCIAEGAYDTGNLIEDVHKRVHTAELLYVATNNVPWDDAADDLDHAVGNAGEAV